MHSESLEALAHSAGDDETFRLQEMQEELETLQATKIEYLQLQ